MLMFDVLQRSLEDMNALELASCATVDVARFGCDAENG